MTEQQPARTRDLQTTRFLVLYAMAVAGGAIAYMPFLTMVLPVRIAALGDGQTISWIANIAFCGAIAASIANVGFGWLSDITGSRRIWIVAGLVLSSALLIAMPLATTPLMLLMMIVIWQFALNMMLSPLAAWGGDCIPDPQKGRLGGLLAFAPAMGALAGAIVTIPGLVSADGRPLVIALMVAATVLPVLLLGAPKPMPQLMQDTKALSVESEAQGAKRPVARMWLARLLVQIAEAALFAFLLIWFMTLDEGFGDNGTAIVFAVVIGLSVPAALASGRWSDLHQRPMLPLAISSAIATVGLAAMALAPDLLWGVAGYVLFGLATGVFLALHSAQTLRILPRASRRGRDLGMFNLTNTVPSMIMPGITLALVPSFGFPALFGVLAGLCALASFTLFALVRRG